MLLKFVEPAQPPPFKGRPDRISWVYHVKGVLIERFPGNVLIATHQGRALPPSLHGQYETWYWRHVGVLEEQPPTEPNAIEGVA